MIKKYKLVANTKGVVVNILIAHRGFRTKTGENRMIDFKEALKICKAVEFDIRMTKDRKIIIFHDHNFKRIGQIYQTVRSLTYSEIKKIKFFKENPEWLPALFIEEFAKTLGEEYTFINVEIKPDRYNRQEYKMLEDALYELAEYTNAEIVVSSFGLADLKFISNLGFRFKKGYLFEYLNQVDFELLKKFDYLHPYLGVIKSSKNIEKIKTINLPMNIWTFKDNESVKMVCEIYGKSLIHGFISDKSDLKIDWDE